MMKTYATIGLLALGGLVVIGVSRNPDLEGRPRMIQAADSVVVERVPSHFEIDPRLARGDERIPHYRVTLTGRGDVDVESWPSTDSATNRRIQLQEESLASILDAAGALPLDAVPEDLMGVLPYCGEVRSDSHSVVVMVFTGTDIERVRDYHGCAEENDESEVGALRGLRALEELVDFALGQASVPALRPLARG